MTEVLHEIYLPFTENQLSGHFAPTLRGGDPERHMTYYRDSLETARLYSARDNLVKPTRAETRAGRQVEKDERFWVVSALMSLYHNSTKATRAEAFAGLLSRAGLVPVAPFTSWTEALDGHLDLYFEVSLPAPKLYSDALRDELELRCPIPYVRELAPPRRALEGATKVDAMLIASATHIAVSFEAKVLSDVSSHVTYDVTRNQLARNIDVLLEKGNGLAPLNSRWPDRSCLVLLTPELLRNGKGAATSRLYGWLMPEYRKPTSSVLHDHLPHRSAATLKGFSTRLGWATWEDCNRVMPDACRWLR
jgi:hypothetical protein